MNKLFTWLFGAIISVALVYLLLSMVNLNYAMNLAANVSIKILILCFLIFFLTFIFMALSFRLALKRAIPFKDMFFISSAHFMFNSLLPARTGELSYFYFLKNKDISISRGIATLTVVRFFDIFALVLLLLFSVLILFNIVPSSIKLLLVVLLVLLLLISIIYISTHKFHSFLFSKEYKNRWLDKVMKYLNNIWSELNQIKLRRLWFLFLLYALLRWITNYSIYYFILDDLNLHFNIGIILIASIVPILTTFLPIQGIAGFGAREAVWTMILVAFGVSKEPAILSGFIIHIVLVGYTLFFGGLSFVYFLFKKKS